MARTGGSEVVHLVVGLAAVRECLHIGGTLDGGAPESCLTSHQQGVSMGGMVMFEQCLRNPHMMGILYSYFPRGLKTEEASPFSKCS